MATGLEMFDALRRMIRHVPAGTEFRINRFDAIDLCKLTVDDLKHRSVDPDVAEKIVPELLRTGDVALLNVVLGVRLGIDRTAPGVIPGEGIRQSAGALKDDPQTLEEMLEELRLIRHGPEAKP